MQVIKKLAFGVCLIWAMVASETVAANSVVTWSNVNAITGRCVKFLANNPAIIDGSIASSSQEYFEWSGEYSTIAYNCFPQNRELESFFRGNSILGIVNKMSLDLVDEIIKFEPRKKGEFEKTADYEKSISNDKSEHIKKYGNTKLNLGLYAYVWKNIMGNIYIESNSNLRPVYNADKEVLSIKVALREYSIYFSFDIPMTPDKAQKLFNAFGGAGVFVFSPILTVYLEGENLIIKKLSLKPSSSSFKKEEYDSLGIDLENIPANIVIKRAVGSEIGKIFEANIKKMESK